MLLSNSFMPQSLSIFQGSTEQFTEFKYSNLFKSYQYLHHNHLNRRKMSSLSLELVLDLDLLLKLDPSNSLSLIVDGFSTTLLSDISRSKSVESKSCACLLVNNWRLGQVELPDDSWVGVSIVCLLWKPTFSYKKRYNYALQDDYN